MRGSSGIYQTADEIDALAAVQGITRSTATGIFAALSPGTDIDRNHKLAATMIATGDCAHAYGDAIRKARRIRNG